MTDRSSCARLPSMFSISNHITEGIKHTENNNKIKAHSFKIQILTATDPIVATGVMRFVTSRAHDAIWIASARVIGWNTLRYVLV